MMEYTPIEQQALDMMRKTDFKNLSKNDVMSIVSKLKELKPEVARDIVAQFPEFVKLTRESLENYKDILGDIIASDDESLKQVYAIADKDIDNSVESRKQFYDLAEKVLDDYSKCLDNPNLTPEEGNNIRVQEIEILKIVSDKDSEIRNHEAEIIKMTDKKDSEKRRFNWELIAAASAALVAVLTITVSILGNDVNIKLPGKRQE